MTTEPEDIAADTSGGTDQPKDGPTPAGVSAPPRDAHGTPIPPGAPAEDEPPAEGAIALDTRMADADRSADPEGAQPTRPAPTPERR